MCGISGIIQPKNFDDVLELIEAQINQLRHRGEDSYGLLAIPKLYSEIEPLTIKALDEKSFINKVKNSKELKYLINKGQIDLLIIHNRAASIGGINLNKQHPVKIQGHIYVIQNGTNYFIVRTFESLMNDFSQFLIDYQTYSYKTKGKQNKSDEPWYTKLSDTQAIGYVYAIARLIASINANKKSVKNRIKKIFAEDFQSTKDFKLYTLLNISNYNVVYVNNSLYNQVLISSMFNLLEGSGVVFIYDSLTNQLLWFKDSSRTLVYNPKLKVFASEPIYLASKGDDSLKGWLKIPGNAILLSSKPGKTLAKMFETIGEPIKEVKLNKCGICYEQFLYVNDPEFNHGYNYCGYCLKHIPAKYPSNKPNTESKTTNKSNTTTNNDYQDYSLSSEVYPYYSDSANDTYKFFELEARKGYVLNVEGDKLWKDFRKIVDRYNEFMKDYDYFEKQEFINLISSEMLLTSDDLYNNELEDIASMLEMDDVDKDILKETIEYVKRYFGYNVSILLDNLSTLLDKEPQSFELILAFVKTLVNILVAIIYDIV